MTAFGARSVQRFEALIRVPRKNSPCKLTRCQPPWTRSNLNSPPLKVQWTIPDRKNSIPRPFQTTTTHHLHHASNTCNKWRTSSKPNHCIKNTQPSPLRSSPFIPEKKNRRKMAAPAVRLFLLPLCLSLAVVSATATAPGPELIRETCRNARSQQDLCVALLSSEPKSNTSDVRGLLGIALNLTAENATKTADFIADFLDESVKKIADAGLQQCLAYCEDEYIDAVDQLTNAAAALESKVYRDVKQWLAVAIADVKKCQEECRDVSVDKQGLTKRNGDVDRLCNIALSITRLLF